MRIRPNLRTALTTGLSVLGLVAVVLIVAACGGDDGNGMGGMMGDNGSGGMGGMMGDSQPAGSIRVDLLNWEVRPSQGSAKSGEVTFWAVHEMGHQHMSEEGGVTHDLQVMRKRPDGSFDLVGQVQGLRMGEAKALTLELDPGEYELSCIVVEDINGTLVGHYPKGMVADFTVTL
ncbi:MAG TPA: hypothetical protein VLA89_02415 [Gemmatimonadales bacterium]|nr:hypothetical protein [Gemmatimonadales bacterium]